MTSTRSKKKHILDADVLFSLCKGKILDIYFSNRNNSYILLSDVYSEIKDKESRTMVDFCISNATIEFIDLTSANDNLKDYFLLRFFLEGRLYNIKKTSGEISCLAYCKLLKDSEDVVLVSSNVNDYMKIVKKDSIKYLRIKDVLRCFVILGKYKEDEIIPIINRINEKEKNPIDSLECTKKEKIDSIRQLGIC